MDAINLAFLDELEKIARGQIVRLGGKAQRKARGVDKPEQSDFEKFKEERKGVSTAKEKGRVWRAGAHARKKAYSIQRARRSPTGQDPLGGPDTPVLMRRRAGSMAPMMMAQPAIGQAPSMAAMAPPMAGMRMPGLTERRRAQQAWLRREGLRRQPPMTGGA